ncbi:MAG: HEAT repeat domain-containing protein [Desulfobacteraceae bacterium]|nr:HEAT repeat domain-containing protein [Desulfobacteraceae bacterium]
MGYVLLTALFFIYPQTCLAQEDLTAAFKDQVTGEVVEKEEINAEERDRRIAKTQQYIPQLKPSTNETDLLKILEDLGSWGADAKAAIPDLRDLFLSHKTNKKIKKKSSRALRRIGQKIDDNAVINIFIGAFGDDQKFVRTYAARNSGYFNSDKVVPGLIKLIDDREKGVRKEALKALAMIGPIAKAAIPRLKKMLGFWGSADKAKVKAAAANALERITGEGTDFKFVGEKHTKKMGKLVDNLGQSAPDRKGLSDLADMGRFAVPYITKYFARKGWTKYKLNGLQVLNEMADKQDGNQKRIHIKAVKGAFEDVLKLLEDPDPAVRREAAKFFKNRAIDSHTSAQIALAGLQKLTAEDPDVLVKQVANEAVEKLKAPKKNKNRKKNIRNKSSSPVEASQDDVGDMEDSGRP